VKKRRKVGGADPLKGGFSKKIKRGGAAGKMTEAELAASRIKVKVMTNNIDNYSSLLIFNVSASSACT
jgi:hypothetical protein